MKNDIKLDINIFEQLNQLELKSHHHKGFVLAYMCATQLVWLEGDYYKKAIKPSDLMRMTGFSKTNPSFSYIIKRNGLLEKAGIVTTSKDFPVKSAREKGKNKMFSELSQGVRNTFINKHSNNFTAKKPEYLFSGENCLIDRERDFITVTRKEFDQCISAGGSSLLLFFVFIKISQFRKATKIVTITHSDFTQHLGFSASKITTLIKHLQNSSIVHLTRNTLRNKQGLTYRLNGFTVISLVSKGELTKFMNQPKEEASWG